MAIYAIGDIQGSYEPLMRLLDDVRFDPDQDSLWCVGDLVNRGPQSLEVLRFLKNLGSACRCVLGNHDLHLLGMAARGKSGGDHSLAEVMAAPDRDELIDWLRRQPILFHDEDSGWCMVHAGLHPGWTLAEAKRRAEAVHTLLRGPEWGAFCSQMEQRFPEREPEAGDPEATVFDAAVITRVRYCTQDGKMCWSVRSGEPTSPAEKAWFAHDELAWRGDCRVVYGHWAAKGLVVDQSHVLGLDSGCVWGGALTAARLDGEMPQLTSVACEGYRKIGS
jgi:bis(5'-nucleosyl)-tetraphosphatase (symmetrical)